MEALCRFDRSTKCYRVRLMIKDQVFFFSFSINGSIIRIRFSPLHENYEFSWIQ